MPEFVTCKHCDETGTCKNRADGGSCARCAAYWVREIKNFQPKENEFGLVCSICWGKGVTEPTSSKWQNRFTPLLAGGFVVLTFALVFVFGIWGQQHFDKILVFAGTLIGSITGYYFGGAKLAAQANAPVRKMAIQKNSQGGGDPN